MNVANTNITNPGGSFFGSSDGSGVTFAAVKHDAGKPRYDLLSALAVEGQAKVLGFGVAKYAAHNWRKGLEWSRLIRSALGHILAFMRGEDLDPESGLPHLDHAQCCLMFLSEYQKTGTGTDDRWVAP